MISRDGLLEWWGVKSELWRRCEGSAATEVNSGTCLDEDPIPEERWLDMVGIDGELLRMLLASGISGVVQYTIENDAMKIWDNASLMYSWKVAATHEPEN